MRPEVKELLQELGYTVEFNGTPVKCHLRRGREHWRGQGSSPQEALQDSLHKACPSALAWTA